MLQIYFVGVMIAKRELTAPTTIIRSCSMLIILSNIFSIYKLSILLSYCSTYIIR